MKKAFEQDLLERTLKPSSPKAKNTFLSTRNLDLHPSLSAQANQGTSPKHPQTVRNLDLRTTISHEINSYSPPSREKVLSQRDILLKIPVDLYNKDQIYDAVHIFQNPRDKLKMIDLVLERRNQINERKKRKKLAKAMTLLPEVTGSGTTTQKYQEPEPLNIVNRFRKTVVQLDDQAEQAFHEEEGIQPATKGTKRKMHLARTQTALKSQSEMSDSDDSDSSTDSVKLVFPMDDPDKGKNLRRRGSILQVRMSGTTPGTMFKFGELNPIAEDVAAGPAGRNSINDLNLEKRKSLRQKDDQGQGGELAQPILRRKNSFGLVTGSPKPKEEGQSNPEVRPPATIMRRKGSLNQVIKPKEEIVPEMPALLRRKNSVSVIAQQQQQQQNAIESPPAVRRRSSVNLTLAAIVTGKISTSEATTAQEQVPPQLGTSPVLIHHPKKIANKSVSLAGAAEIIKIAKSEPNDQAYSLGGKSLQRDLSRFLLTNKDHSLSQLLLRHSPTMSPKLKQIQNHVKNQYQEITGFKPEKLPNLSSSPFKPESNKGLGSPRKLNQILQKTAGDFAKDFGKKNRSIKQKSVSLIRMTDPADQLQLTTDPSSQEYFFMIDRIILKFE